MYKLLIIDDEARIVEGLKLMMDWRELQFQVIETATTYAEALDKAVEIQPDIALVDVCIHDKKGYDLIQYLQRFQLNTRYVMISGYDEFKYIKKAMKLGVKDYILKPIDKKELRETIEKIIVEEFHGTIDTGGSKDCDPVLQKDYKEFSKLTQKVILMVQQNYKENISLKYIGDQFHMNSTYLGQLFMKDTKMKFSEYLMRYRMQLAKELIETTQDKISYIALEVGYSNLNYFYTQFQACYQESPLEFRK